MQRRKSAEQAVNHGPADRFVDRAAVALILAFALGAYANALRNPWHLDDNVIILRDRRVHHADAWSIISQEYWPGGGFGNRVYRPLTTLTLAANWALSREPWTFRLVNLLLHAGAGLALYALVRRLTDRPPMALAAALLYVVHPIHTTPMNQVVDRADIGAAACVLTALWLMQPRRAGESVGVARGVLAAAVFAAGLLFKENAVVLPLLALGCDAWRWHTSRPGDAGPAPPRKASVGRVAGAAWGRVAVRVYVPLMVVLAGYLCLRVAVLGVVARSAGDINPLDNVIANPAGVGAQGDAWLMRWGTPVALLSLAARLLAWPVRLSWDYSYAAVTPVVSWHDPGLWGGVIVLGLLVVSAVVAWRRRSVVLVGLSLMVGAYSVVSNTAFLIGAAFAERYLMLPCAGFCLCAAALVLGGASRSRLPTAARVAVVIVLLTAAASRSIVRNLDFRSPERLDLADVASQPDSSRLWKAAAAAALNAGDNATAFQRAQHALSIFDRNPEAWRILGLAAMRMNQSGAALEALLKSVEYGGGHDETVHVAIGQALRMKGDYRAAIEWLEAHAPLDRNAATVRNNLAWYLLTADPPELRDPARACRYAAEAVEIEPAVADLLDTYLAALHAAGRGAEAAAVLERRLPRIEGTAAREALLRKWDRPAD